RPRPPNRQPTKSPKPQEQQPLPPATPSLNWTDVRVARPSRWSFCQELTQRRKGAETQRVEGVDVLDAYLSQSGPFQLRINAKAGTSVPANMRRDAEKQKN